MKTLALLWKKLRCRFFDRHAYDPAGAIIGPCPHCGGQGVVAMTLCCRVRRFIHAPDKNPNG